MCRNILFINIIRLYIFYARITHTHTLDSMYLLYVSQIVRIIFIPYIWIITSILCVSRDSILSDRRTNLRLSWSMHSRLGVDERVWSFERLIGRLSRATLGAPIRRAMGRRSLNRMVILWRLHGAKREARSSGSLGPFRPRRDLNLCPVCLSTN